MEDRKGREVWFVLAAAAAVLLCLALAFWYAVPLKSNEVAASVPLPMVQATHVNLNTAEIDALCTLPGIGEKKALAILDDRNQNGPFRKVKDVLRVPGITEYIVDQWGDLACVR